MIEVRDLRFDYPGTRALDRVSFRLAAGSVTALVGPNGAGKTTLFAVISGFEPATSGQIGFRGSDITTLPTHKRALDAGCKAVGATVHFVTPDLDDAVSELEAKGVAVEQIRVDEYTDRRYTFFKDPDGLPLELYEDGPR